jgi:hypothetical protein
LGVLVFASGLFAQPAAVLEQPVAPAGDVKEGATTTVLSLGTIAPGPRNRFMAEYLL